MINKAHGGPQTHRHTEIDRLMQYSYCPCTYAATPTRTHIHTRIACKRWWHWWCSLYMYRTSCSLLRRRTEPPRCAAAPSHLAANTLLQTPRCTGSLQTPRCTGSLQHLAAPPRRATSPRRAASLQTPRCTGSLQHLAAPPRRAASPRRAKHLAANASPRRHLAAPPRYA
eukprot:COSAG02_NODE_2453_length_8820_cov_6.109964_6_plen_170_part_00